MCLIEETKKNFGQNDSSFFHTSMKNAFFFKIKSRFFYFKNADFFFGKYFFDVEHLKIHMHFNLDGFF